MYINAHICISVHIYVYKFIYMYINFARGVGHLEICDGDLRRKMVL
jgi:hypothetical protein